jgi:hypothetical protein
MKIKTELLQKMVSKAIQGASFNKMIPLTSLIGIEFKEDNLGGKGNLILITTDGSNTFKINQEVEGNGEFYTIVNADTFAKLVGKTTKEFIELENKENYLEVNGNGTYKLEIAINEEGEMVRFPIIIENLPKETIKLNLNDLQEAIKVAKASTAKTMELPCLTGYYIADNIIATNREMICILKNKFFDEPVLISSEMAELILLVEGETLEFVQDTNTIVMFNTNYIITGKELEGKENYPATQILEVLNNKYENTIKVNKTELLNVLDRMNLFVTDYDKGGIYLDFNAAGIIVRSQKSNAYETISVTDSNNAEPFNCLVDIEMLKSQVETVSTDIVEIAYGQDTSIKIVDGNIIHIISLAQKE